MAGQSLPWYCHGNREEKVPGPSVAYVGEIKKIYILSLRPWLFITFLYVLRCRITVSGIFVTYGYVIDCVKVKVKVKYTLVQALRLCTGRAAHRGSGGIALPLLDHCTRRGWGVSVTTRPPFTPGKHISILYVHSAMGGGAVRENQWRSVQ